MFCRPMVFEFLSRLESVIECTMIIFFFFLSLPASAADLILAVLWWCFVSKQNGLSFLFTSNSGLQPFLIYRQTYCGF